MTAAKRVSVTLDGLDQQAIAAFIDPGRPEYAALQSWAIQHGLSVRDDSEAALLRALVRAGVQALRLSALEQGYERLAASRSDDQDERRAVRDRAVGRAESRYTE
jgi:hypothetical protein